MNLTERDDFEQNKWSATGCFPKDKMLALLDALRETIVKYPEPLFSFKIKVEGRYPIAHQSKLVESI